MCEGFFVLRVSQHTHLFSLIFFFSFLCSHIWRSLGRFFCLFILCSFLLHSCPRPSSLLFLFFFSYTRVDINISLSLSSRCVLPSSRPQNDHLRMRRFFSPFSFDWLLLGWTLVTAPVRSNTQTAGFVGLAVRLLVWTPLFLLTSDRVSISQVVQKSLKIANKQQRRKKQSNTDLELQNARMWSWLSDCSEPTS